MNKLKKFEKLKNVKTRNLEWYQNIHLFVCEKYKILDHETSQFRESIYFLKIESINSTFQGFIAHICSIHVIYYDSWYTIF